jgi:hypothetical protein
MDLLGTMMSYRVLHARKNKNTPRIPFRRELSLEFLEDRLTPAAPTVATLSPTSLTPVSAVLGGTVSNDGGLLVIKRGVVFSLTSQNANPTIGGAGVMQVDAPPYANLGAFYVTVGNLAANNNYTFRAFAINPDGTGYAPPATFVAPPGIVMPNSTVTPQSPTDWATLNQVLFFQPTPGQTLPGSNTPIPTIPEKQVTITNNMTTTVYPFMRDAASTLDDLAASKDLPENQRIYQGLYDPIDQMFQEYRGYLGFNINGANYLGLPPGMTITVSVPLVFWDGARFEIGIDGTYLVNSAQVGAELLSPNPYQYYDRNPDGSSTARVALPALSSSNGPIGANGQAATGMVMWYRQGLNNQTDRHQIAPQQAKAPANDAPTQLTEWTMRDPVLSILNPNIDKSHPNFGETHANINYDVSYVDSMALPVAMEALDVPIAVQTVPPLDPRNPNPGPRLPFGWIGAAQTPEEFQAAIAAFTSTGPQNGLGSYFDGKGWPTYDLPGSAFPAGAPPIKIPSGQDAIQDTPLADKSSSYDILANLYMLTSGGTTAKQVVGGAAAFSDGSNTLYIVATPDQQAKLEQELQRGMILTMAGGSGGPAVPAGTKILTIGPNDQGFVYTTYNETFRVLQVGLNNAIPTSGTSTFGYNLARERKDYATSRMIDIWYTWAQYYVQHVGGTPYSNQAGASLTTDPKMPNNVIKLNVPASSVTGLRPGMLVTGSADSGIAALRADGTGATTILSIDPDGVTLHLSQAVGVSAPGSTYTFALPTMSSPGMVGFDQATPLAGFNPTDGEIAGVPKILDFAQNVYQLLSLMSQVPDTGNGPISTQILGNVIGGNIAYETLNPDVFHNTEVAYRTKIKSLLRGVNDFNVQNDQTTWYPRPDQGTAGQTFNAYNLDPFVWFVHKQMGLSGYGFSLDDDTADVSGNFSTKLGIAIGGLNGLPNQFEWTNPVGYGPVTGTGTVKSAQEIAGFSPYMFFSVLPYNKPEQIPGSNISGVGVPPGTSLADFGNGGLYAYSYFVTNSGSTPADRLQIPPLALNATSQFTFRGNGRVNYGPNTFVLPAGVTQAVAPYMNALVGLTIPNGSTFQITTPIGTQTSYTQQFEQLARVSIVPTAALNASGHGPAAFVDNAPLPDLVTIVDGVLHVGRANIVDGWLTGIGTIEGNLNLFGPVAGYADPIEMKPVDKEPVDTSWNNLKNTIRATSGGFLAAGRRGATAGDPPTPGKLTVTGDVSLFGATFTVFAKGATTQGADYSWVDSAGRVNLGNSKLAISLAGFNPKMGNTLTILTAAKGIAGKFSQGDSITVNGFTFSITYNANSVVLTTTAVAGPVTQFYRSILNRDPEPAAETYWTNQLNSGTSRFAVVQSIYDSAEHRGKQVDGYYQSFFNRSADEAGRANWISALQGGLNENEVQAGFLTSAEYRSLHPDVASFVNGVFQDVLDREVDAAGLAFWQNVASTPVGQSLFASNILNCDEEDKQDVDEAYQRRLDRTPDAVGLANWLAILSQNTVSSEVVDLALLASDEFVGIGFEV